MTEHILLTWFIFFCRYPGLNLLGGDLSSQKGGHGIETNSVDHCRNECKRRTECAFWEEIQHDMI